MERRGGQIVANVQALRLAAASLVLVRHLLDEGVDHGFLAHKLPFAGGFGVDLFFVLSGFVMMHNAGDSFGKPGAPWKFFQRRLQRIVPIYWLFTTLVLVVMLVAPSTMNKSNANFWHVVASYAFFPSRRVEDGQIQPILGLGWTLNYELFFYVLFALALFLPRRFGLPALVAMLALLSLAHPFVPDTLPPLLFWTQPIILEFAGGIGLALLYRAGAYIPPWAAILVIAVAVFLVPGNPSIRWLFWGGPALAIAAAVTLTSEPRYANPLGRAILLGGDASYALYLSHPFSVNVIGIVARELKLGLPLYVVLAFFGSIGASILVHLLVENPMRDLIRGRKKKKAEPISGDVAVARID